MHHGWFFYLALGHCFGGGGIDFGTKKLRNAGRDIGGAVHDFKKGMNEGNAEIDAAKKAKEADAIEHEKKDV